MFQLPAPSRFALGHKGPQSSEGEDMLRKCIVFGSQNCQPPQWHFFFFWGGGLESSFKINQQTRVSLPHANWSGGLASGTCRLQGASIAPSLAGGCGAAQPHVLTHWDASKPNNTTARGERIGEPLAKERTAKLSSGCTFETWVDEG